MLPIVKKILIAEIYFIRQFGGFPCLGENRIKFQDLKFDINTVIII